LKQNKTTWLIKGPAIHPMILAMLQARGSTPDPTTPVTMRAAAGHTVPSTFINYFKFGEGQTYIFI